MIDLLCKTGPLEGQRFHMDKAEPTVLGRQKKGVNIPDPLVSIQHAEIWFDHDAWHIRDLKSAKGTFIDGKPVPSDERGVELRIGHRLVIGESEFLVDSRSTRWLRRLIIAVSPLWVLVLVAFATLFWFSGESPVTLTAPQVVRTAAGASADLTVPFGFLRKFGLQTGKLRLRRVTDFDADAIDELWLHHGEDQYVVTSGEAGSWRVLGVVPVNCTDRAGDEFPDLDCGGEKWRMMDAGYRPVAQDGVVVWMVPGADSAVFKPEDDPEEPEPEPEPKAKAKGKGKGKGKAKGKPKPKPKPKPSAKGPDAGLVDAEWPTPYHFSLASPDSLAGFLMARGVDGAVHYIVCERAIEGVPAHVLTDSGEQRVLAYGCRDDVDLLGVRSQSFEGARPGIIALTSVGRRAVLDDLRTSLSGGPDGAFLSGDHVALADAAAAQPISRLGAIRVKFDAPPHMFNPLAAEKLVSGRRVFPDGDDPGTALTATLLTPGVATLDPPGCAQLEVTTGNFRCALIRGCVAAGTFMRVKQTGCGDDVHVVASSYTGGHADGSTDQLDVRIVVDSTGMGMVTDVLRARVSYRVKP